MSILASDPQTQLAFSVYESKGVFAVLLGLGLSRVAEVPTGWEITLDLIRRVALAQGVKDQPDCERPGWHSSNADKLAAELQAAIPIYRHIHLELRPIAGRIRW